MMMGKKNGFMLLEVILSVLIIASGVIFVMRSFSTSLRANQAVKGLQSAYQCLDETLFDLEAKEGIEREGYSGKTEDNSCSWQLAASPLPDNENISSVNLKVVYGRGKRARAIEISTYLKNKKT